MSHPVCYTRRMKNMKNNTTKKEKVFKVTFANGGSVLTEDHSMLWALTRMVAKNRKVEKIEEVNR